MDIRLLPEDYLAQETYRMVCLDDAESGEFSQNLLWPMLSQIERLSYSFPLDNPIYTLTFAENLAQRTNNVLQGMLNAELILQRS
jgi:hypothetical protein